jgi:pyruvate formate lyase activating enzyme
MREAILYEKLDRGRVRCRLCRHQCTISPGKTGICAVRRNEEGRLYTLVFDRVAAAGVDPIEKKPLFHFYPGSLAYSIATMGCNFSCLHCQNAGLSKPPADQSDVRGRPISPERIVETARSSGCRSISYTYTEPTIFAELALETARLAKAQGLANNFVTNGYQSPELIGEMQSLIDAANVDLKSFSSDFYKEICGAELEGVLDTIERLHDAGIWLEITTLIIPTKNDDHANLREIARFIAGVDQNIPWHVSRFHPAHLLTQLPATPVSTLFRAREIGHEEGLRYIYTGNIPGQGGENTNCPSCHALLIERAGFMVGANRVARGRCPDCGEALAGRFES